MQSCTAWGLITFAMIAPSRAATAGGIAGEGFALAFPYYAEGGTGFSGPWMTGGFNAFACGYRLGSRSLCHRRLAPDEAGSLTGGAFRAGVVKADLDLGVVSKIGVYSSGPFEMDAIRIGTSFKEVVPLKGAVDCK